MRSQRQQRAWREEGGAGVRPERRLPWRRTFLCVLLLACLAACSSPAPPVKPPPLAPAPQPPPPAPEPPADLKLELSAEEKTALTAQANEDLEEAEKSIRSLDREKLTAEEIEKLHTVENLVVAARAAEEKDDIPGMANLARKARLLAEELVHR